MPFTDHRSEPNEVPDSAPDTVPESEPDFGAEYGLPKIVERSSGYEWEATAFAVLREVEPRRVFLSDPPKGAPVELPRERDEERAAMAALGRMAHARRETR